MLLLASAGALLLTVGASAPGTSTTAARSPATATGSISRSSGGGLPGEEPLESNATVTNIIEKGARRRRSDRQALGVPSSTFSRPIPTTQRRKNKKNDGKQGNTKSLLLPPPHEKHRKNKNTGSATTVCTSSTASLARGGAARGTTTTGSSSGDPGDRPPPSMYWAVLHNWLYFLSLGFNAVNIPYMIRTIVDGEASTRASPQSIALSGNVEAVDKILTFAGVAYLSALSDKHGRRPLIAWSAFGFAITNLLQAFAGEAPGGGLCSKALLYLADLVDGCSSCMAPVCQAYVADCTAAALASSSSSRASLASNLGIFQGISIGGAFIFAFPIGGLLGAKCGPRLPILMAAGFQFVNGLIAMFLTPESNAAVAGSDNKNTNKSILFSEVNPITGLQKLFGIGPSSSGFASAPSARGLLRVASLTYFFLSMARGALDAQFVNYSNLRFGWTQAQSGPVLVMTGIMLAILPRVLVPVLGLKRSINYGLLVYALGLTCAGLASTSASFVASIAVVAIGCVSIPASQALLANLAPKGESGALLGAVGSLTELTGAIGSSLYATLLASFTVPSVGNASGTADGASASSILPRGLEVPGMHFLVGATFCLIGWMISAPGLNRNRDHPALNTAVDKSALSAAAS